MTTVRRFHILKSGTEAVMSTGILVAFASGDLKHVDQHFGSATGFALYRVTPDTALLEQVIQFDEEVQDGNENKLIPKIAALNGCAAVYCQAVGGSAVQQLVKLGVQPVKVSPGAPIGELLQDLQNEMASGPSAWVARALSKVESDNGRFKTMADEGWEE